MEKQESKHHGHDTHAKPPQAICNLYKKYQKMDDSSVDDDLNVVDFRRGLTPAQRKRLVPVAVVDSKTIAEAEATFKGYHLFDMKAPGEDVKITPCTVYEHKDFDGLKIFPSLIPTDSQSLMLDALLHRDLANPLHKTNIHHDYNIPYPTPAIKTTTARPSSFFTFPQSSKSEIFTPLNPLSNHKNLNTAQFLQKKLRWLTLGSQYDWTTRAYSDKSPTPFPPDIAALLTKLFNSSFTPESGVVLLYSTKDFMPVHRDVSEECRRELASFTLGCDGVFIIARDREDENGLVDEQNEDREQDMFVLRVRSGDVVQMGGKTRWSWHAMPKVIGGTCPTFLEDWPVKDGSPKEFEKWKGFMRRKRLNISCRQVWS